MLAIGVDIGTSTLCAVVVDSQSGSIVDSITIANQFTLNGRAFESLQNPQEIIKASQKLIENFTQKYSIGAIGVTGQMHGIVYLDDRQQAVSPLYTWQDQRGSQIYKGQNTYADYLSESQGFGMVTHFYNTVNSAINENATVFCTIHDYLVTCLTANTVVKIHPSNAASFGCYDILTNSFNTSVVGEKYIPAVECCQKIAGQTRDGIPVSIAIGDNQASFIGAVKYPEQSVLVNVGTGSQICAVTNRCSSTELEMRPYDNNSYLNVGAALCGGRAYAALKNFFSPVVEETGGQSDKLYDIINKLGECALADGAELEVDTRFCGTRKIPSIRGSVNGICLENFTPGALAVGILKGIAKELHEMYRLMQFNEQPSILVGAGNGIRKNILLQRIFSQMFNLPLYIPCYSEEAAFGAALFALTAVGRFKDLSSAQQIIQLREVKV